MQLYKRRVLSVALALALCLQLCAVASASAVEPIYTANNMTFSTGTDAVEIPASAVSQLAALEGGTIIVDFTPTATSTANSLFSLSNSSVSDGYFNLYIDNRGFLGLEVRNHGETRYVNLQGPAEVTRNARHIMALSADPVDGYKFYFDGALVFQMPVALYELWEYDYRFMSTVTSADVGYIGATYRNGSFGYPYYGSIDSVRVYDSALNQSDLEAATHIDKAPALSSRRTFSPLRTGTPRVFVSLPSSRPTRGPSSLPATSGSATLRAPATTRPTTATSASASAATVARPGAHPKCFSTSSTIPTSPRCL